MRSRELTLGAEAPPSPAARLVEQTLAIIAYSEIRAIMLAWAGVRAWPPAIRARVVVEEVLAAGERGDLVERAQARLRAESAELLDLIIQRHGTWPFDRIIGHGQLGSVAGLEALFHEAGQRSAAHRGDDRRLLALAVGLADFVRTQAAAAGNPLTP